VSGETVTSEVGIGIKKSLKIPTGQSESVYRNLALNLEIICFQFDGKNDWLIDPVIAYILIN
jgi:hypothetical protein